MNRHAVNFALFTLLVLAGILFGQDNKVNANSASLKGDSKAPLPGKIKCTALETVSALRYSFVGDAGQKRTAPARSPLHRRIAAVRGPQVDGADG